MRVATGLIVFGISRRARNLAIQGVRPPAVRMRDGSEWQPMPRHAEAD